jgi:GT2 family glycosyltransferase
LEDEAGETRTVMTVHVLTAVHNRCETTRTFLNDIFDQHIDETLRIVVVDDGSTDGTGGMLREHAQQTPANVTLSVVDGDGSWWWAKSMARAVDAAREHIAEDDVVIFMNDDIRVPTSTVAELAHLTRSHGCIARAALRQVDAPETVLDRGSVLEERTLSVIPLSTEQSVGGLTSVDVAPGRTVAYPGAIFTRGLNIDHARLPHHLADLEFSIRASREGFPIQLAEDVSTLSVNEVGLSRSPGNLVRRLTHISSSDRLLSYWAFWRTVLPELPRWILAIRFVRYLFLPNVLMVVPWFNTFVARRGDHAMAERPAK